MSSEKLEILIKTIAEQAAKDIGDLTKKFQEMENQAKESDKRAKDLESRLDDVGTSAKTAGGKTETLGDKMVKLQAVFGVMGNTAGKVFDAFKQGIQDAAASGDKESQALLGSVESLKKSFQPLVQVLVDQLLPAIIPLIEAAGKMASSTSAWIKENNAITVALQSTVSVVQALIGFFDGVFKSLDQLISLVLQSTTSFGGLGEVFQWVGQKVEDAWGVIGAALGNGSIFNQAVAIMQSFASEIIRLFSSLAIELSDLAGYINTDFTIKLSTDLAVLSRNWAGTADKWSQDAVRISDATEDVSGKTSGAAESMIGSLESFKSSIGGVSEETINKYAGMSEAVKNLQLTEEERQLKEEEALQKDIEEAEKKMLLIEESVNKQIGANQLLLDSADAAAIKAEEQSQLNAERLMGEMELAAQTFEEKLRMNELSMASDEEITRRKIELYKEIANSAQVSADYRKQAEVALLEEQKKIYEQSRKTIEDYSKKASTIVSGMVNGLIFQHKSLKEVVGETVKQLAAELITHLTSMAVTAIAKAAMTALGVGTAATVQKTAQAQVVPSAIASWTAAIPFAGPGLFAAYMATYRGLMAAAEGAMKFAEGGTVSGQVPGLGGNGSDAVSASLGSDEAVLNARATKALGEDGVNALNRGESLGGFGGLALAGGGDLGTLTIVHEVRSSLPTPEAWIDSLAPMIASSLSKLVLHKGGTLTASGFRETRKRR